MNAISWIDMLQAICYIQNGFVINEMIDELDKKQIGSMESFRLMDEIEIARNELRELEEDLVNAEAVA